MRDDWCFLTDKGIHGLHDLLDVGRVCNHILCDVVDRRCFRFQPFSWFHIAGQDFDRLEMAELDNGNLDDFVPCCTQAGRFQINRIEVVEFCKRCSARDIICIRIFIIQLF